MRIIKKNAIIYSFALLMHMGSLGAQTDQGNFTFGSNIINYSFYDRWTQKNETDTSATKNNYETYGGWNVTLYLSASYFLRNNFCIGMEMGKNQRLGRSGLFRPFTRYYLKRKKKVRRKFTGSRSMTFAEFNLDFGFAGDDGIGNKSTFIQRSMYVQSGFGIGTSIFLNNHFTIDGLVMSRYRYQRSLDQIDLSIRNTLGVNGYIGFSYYF